MPEDIVEDVHLETAEGPKPVVEWGQPGAPEPPANELEPEPAGDAPQVYEYQDGSSVTIENPELTGKGWRITLDAGTGKPPEVFYGNTKDEALLNVSVGKLNATRKINELKRANLDAGPRPPQTQPDVTPNRLGANDIFDFKAKFEENPDAALEDWYKKRTGKLPEETAAVADQGQDAVISNEISDILTDWRDNTDDYVVDIRNRDNILTWLLRHKAKENPASFDVNSALDLLYRQGWLTPDYLTLAWEELKDSGNAVIEGEPETPPEPVRQPTTTRPRAGFGIRTRGNMQTRAQATTDAPLTEAQLNSLPDEEIKKLYHGILEMNRTPAGKAAIQDSIQKIREGRR
jgi:hypothetical protein